MAARPTATGVRRGGQSRHDRRHRPTAKAAVRRELRAARRAAAATRDRAADAAAIADAVLAGCVDAIAGGATVAIYRSLPTEPPTDALAAELHARGLPVLVPVLLPDKDLDWCRLLADGSTGPALGLDAIAGGGAWSSPPLSPSTSRAPGSGRAAAATTGRCAAAPRAPSSWPWSATTSWCPGRCRPRGTTCGSTPSSPRAGATASGCRPPRPGTAGR